GVRHVISQRLRLDHLDQRSPPQHPGAHLHLAGDIEPYLRAAVGQRGDHGAGEPARLAHPTRRLGGEPQDDVVWCLRLPDAPRRADDAVDVEVVRYLERLRQRPRSANAVEAKRTYLAGLRIVGEDVDVPALRRRLEDIAAQHTAALPPGAVDVLHLDRP